MSSAGYAEPFCCLVGWSHLIPLWVSFGDLLSIDCTRGRGPELRF